METDIEWPASVTTSMLSTLDLYAQYAGASYCNSENVVGSTVTCSGSACPDVTAAGAKIIASFQYVLVSVHLIVAKRLAYTAKGVRQPISKVSCPRMQRTRLSSCPSVVLTRSVTGSQSKSSYTKAVTERDY
jgi:hypothetical protein